MSKLLDVLEYVVMPVLGATLVAMAIIAVVGFWFYLVPELWRATVGG